MADKENFQPKTVKALGFDKMTPAEQAEFMKLIEAKAGGPVERLDGDTFVSMQSFKDLDPRMAAHARHRAKAVAEMINNAGAIHGVRYVQVLTHAVNGYQVGQALAQTLAKGMTAPGIHPNEMLKVLLMATDTMGSMINTMLQDRGIGDDETIKGLMKLAQVIGDTGALTKSDMGKPLPPDEGPEPGPDDFQQRREVP